MIEAPKMWLCGSCQRAISTTKWSPENDVFGVNPDRKSLSGVLSTSGATTDAERSPAPELWSQRSS